MDNGNLWIESAAISDGKLSKSWHVGDYSNLFGDLQSCTDLLKDLLDTLIQINITQNKKKVKSG